MRGGAASKSKLSPYPERFTGGGTGITDKMGSNRNKRRYRWIPNRYKQGDLYISTYI